MIVYKLTNQDGKTGLEYDVTQWGPGVTHEAPGTGELCTNGWIHAYSHPLIAALLNPIHGDFTEPKLWECEAGGTTKDDHGLKLGCQKLTTIREIPLPEITTAQRVRFAILCANRVHKDNAWNAWADGWLSGKDRSAEAARAAAARAAWAAATWAAAEAAWAARAAWAEATAEEEVARVAEEVARVAADIDLIALAEQAIREEQ